MTVAPAAGTLAAGESTTVTLSIAGPAGAPGAAARAGGGGGGGCGGDNGDGACTEGTLTVNPGGITVTVILDIDTDDNSSPPPSSPPPDNASLRGLVGRLVN